MVEFKNGKWWKRDLVPVLSKDAKVILRWEYGKAYDLQKRRNAAQWFDLNKLLNRDSNISLDFGTRLLEPLGKDEYGNQIPSQVVPNVQKVNDGNLLDHLSEFAKWKREMNKKYFNGEVVPDSELMEKIKQLQNDTRIKTQSLQETYKRQVEMKRLKRELKLDSYNNEENVNVQKTINKTSK